MTNRRSPGGAAAAALLFAGEAWWVSARGAVAFDLAVRDAVHGWASVPLTRVMQAITMLGSHWVLAPIGLLFAAYLAATRRSRYAILFATGTLSAELAVQLLKLWFHRPRPDVFFGLLPAETYSFPSGHSFLSTVFYGLLAAILIEFEPSPRNRAVILTLAAVAAALIGFSRVYLGYHYPSDVLGGWTCGILWLALSNVFMP